MPVESLTKDAPIFINDGMAGQVQIHEALVFSERSTHHSLAGIKCAGPMKIWPEPGHAAVAYQSTSENVTVNAAPLQLDWASVTLEAFHKGFSCIIIHQATMSEIKLHVKS
jgi:hypothetical protein